jgi:tRNA(Ile)-lysidine synthase
MEQFLREHNGNDRYSTKIKVITSRIKKNFPMSDWSDWHSRLHQTLKARSLLPTQTRILLAVSGGQDSLCLLKLLRDLQPHWQWQLSVLHCDHQWRSDSTANAHHVRSLCAQWQIPCSIETATSPPISEAAARTWRYDCLKHRAQTENYPIIVTGHTATDRAETLLYNLTRGSGSTGLQALRWQRAIDATSNIQLVRPLLDFTRDDTTQICQHYQLPVWEDSTNQSSDYARNRIRHTILPLLQQQLNPQATQHLAQTAELLTAEVDYLQTQADLIFQQAIAPDNPTQIDRYILRPHHLALQRRILRQFLTQTLPQAPNFAQIEAVVGLITAPNRSQTPTFSGGYGVVVSDRWLQLRSVKL